MKVCLVYKEEFPWDVRVEKIARTLTVAGNDVTVVARNLDGKPSSEQVDGFFIRRLPKLTWLPEILRRILSAALPLNPLWIARIWTATAGPSTGVMIVRDLPLVLAVVLVGRLRRWPVIFDMAECYPEMYASMRQFRCVRGWSRLSKSPGLAKIYEKVACALVDHVLVMIEESRTRLVRLGVPQEKITIVSNTPSLNMAEMRPCVHEGSQIRIVYVGFVTRLRGLDLLIKGVDRFVRKSGEPGGIRLDIIGKGDAIPELKSLIAELGLESIVQIHGWLAASEVKALVDKANVGALTYRVCGHWNHTIPNKIFDYMFAGLPVLSTNVVPIKRILTSCNAGITVRTDGDADIASALQRLTDPALRATLGENGRRAVLGRFNWQQDELRLRSTIGQLGNHANRQVAQS